MFTDKVTNATVLYDEIRAKGYRGGLSILWEYLTTAAGVASRNRNCDEDADIDDRTRLGVSPPGDAQRQ